MWDRGYDFDGLISTQLQAGIRISWTPPPLPSTDDKYLRREWAEFASCAGLVDVFFRHSCTGKCSEHPKGCDRIRRVRECKAMCAACPVLEHCRIWSLHFNLEFGLAGAMTENERKEARHYLGIQDDPVRSGLWPSESDSDYPAG